MRQQLLVVLSGLLLGCAAAAHALGQGNEPITKKKANAVIVDRQPKVKTKNKEISRPSIGTLPPDEPEPLRPHSILVRIRYRKELGYLEMRGDPFTNESLPYSCRAFDVTFTAPDASGNNARVGSTVQQNDQMKEDSGNGLYSCWFTVSDVPFNRRVLVLGNVINNPSFLTRAWLGGSDARHLLGTERAVEGNIRVMLTADHPSVTVDMVMDYRRVRPLPPLRNNPLRPK